MNVCRHVHIHIYIYICLCVYMYICVCSCVFCLYLYTEILAGAYIIEDHLSLCNSISVFYLYIDTYVDVHISYMYIKYTVYTCTQRHICVYVHTHVQDLGRLRLKSRSSGPF